LFFFEPVRSLLFWLAEFAPVWQYFIIRDEAKSYSLAILFNFGSISVLKGGKFGKFQKFFY